MKNPGDVPDLRPFHVYLYGPSRGPIPASFEDAAERLQKLPMLAFEWDGSFVWAIDGGRQQVYGMLYDARGVVQYCDVRGKCQRDTWRTLCNAIAGLSAAAPALELKELCVMRLPESEWQDFQSFERLTWDPTSQKDSN